MSDQWDKDASHNNTATTQCLTCLFLSVFSSDILPVKHSAKCVCKVCLQSVLHSIKSVGCPKLHSLAGIMGCCNKAFWDRCSLAKNPGMLHVCQKNRWQRRTELLKIISWDEGCREWSSVHHFYHQRNKQNFKRQPLLSRESVGNILMNALYLWATWGFKTQTKCRTSPKQIHI